MIQSEYLFSIDFQDTKRIGFSYSFQVGKKQQKTVSSHLAKPLNTIDYIVGPIQKRIKIWPG